MNTVEKAIFARVFVDKLYSGFNETAAAKDALKYVHLLNRVDLPENTFDESETAAEFRMLMKDDSNV